MKERRAGRAAVPGVGQGCGATKAVGVFDPGFPTQVGGRHVPGPTSPDRDSSREIDKAPGIMLLTHPAAPPRQCNAGTGTTPPTIEIVANRFSAREASSERDAGGA